MLKIKLVMIERPESHICEICGGVHQTAAHLTETQKTPDKGEKSETYESWRERVNKILWGDIDIDAITARDLAAPFGGGGSLKEREDANFFRRMDALILERFPRSREKPSMNPIDIFVQLKDFYNNDKESLQAIDEFIIAFGKTHGGNYLKKLAVERGNDERSIRIIDEAIAARKRFVKQKREKRERVKLSFSYLGGKDRANELYQIGSFLAGKPLEELSFIETLEKNLKEKRILVLGDDTGSLSEVLNSFGAEAVGVEYGKYKVFIAHSGIFSETGVPQKQVVYGDIGELTKQNSELYRQVKQKGPFDVIYSTGVFNGGSGIETAINQYINQYDEYKAFGDRFNPNCISLLKETGFTLHSDVEMRRVFGIFGQRTWGGARHDNLKEKYYDGTGHWSSTVFMPKATYDKVRAMSEKDLGTI